MEPPGICVIVHDKPGNHTSWVIMSHQVGILVHHLTNTDVCSVTCPQLAYQ